MVFDGKRKRTYDDSDDDEPSLGRQILPVANLPANFSGEPLDGMQYLFTVRRDARKLPSVTRALNPYAIPEIKSGPISSSSKQVSLPSQEWRTTFLTRFKNFRKNSVQPTIGVGRLSQVSSMKLMPDRKDRDAWLAFISGEPDYVWSKPTKVSRRNSARRPKLSDPGLSAWQGESERSEVQHNHAVQEIYRINDEGEVDLILDVEDGQTVPTPAATPVISREGDVTPLSSTPLCLEMSSQSINMVPRNMPRDPTPILLSLLNNRYCLHLLMYFDHWITLTLEDSSRMLLAHESYSRWIFALLSRVEAQISANDISQLRTLARSYISLVKTLRLSAKSVPDPTSVQVDAEPGARMSEAACWLVITVIIEFWGQSDLWMDAMDVLSGV